jgi:hypothetical protein
VRIPGLGALLAAVALTAPGSGVAAGSGPYHGTIRIDFRYTSGGNITPGSAADVEQTAHITLTVKHNQITHLHGVVGLDYKWKYDICPNFTVETTGGGTVDGAGDYGGVDQYLDWNWKPKGHYTMPAPSVPETAHVTRQSTTPDQSCNSVSQTDRPTFGLGYVPRLSGYTKTSKRVVGSLTRNYQGFDACHPFGPGPPPPPVGVSCSWHVRWTLVRGR